MRVGFTVAAVLLCFMLARGVHAPPAKFGVPAFGLHSEIEQRSQPSTLSRRSMESARESAAIVVSATALDRFRFATRLVTGIPDSCGSGETQTGDSALESPADPLGLGPGAYARSNGEMGWLNESGPLTERCSRTEGHYQFSVSTISIYVRRWPAWSCREANPVMSLGIGPKSPS
jgi:hypothetical protein